VKYVDARGTAWGPYRLRFDPQAEYVQHAKDVLAITSWLSFREYPKGHLLAYFSHLTSYKNAFSEIRYSVDNESLSRSLRFSSDWSQRGLPGDSDDETYVAIPMSAKYVYVRLRFIDGSVSEPKKIFIAEEGIDR